MFLARGSSNRLLILNGGARKIAKHKLEYYYDNMLNYVHSLDVTFSKYFELENEIAKFIKKLSGYGKIHGCIIDIDFYNHIYFNFFDHTITPYYATSIVDKHVYPNLKSLISNKKPELLEGYNTLISKASKNLPQVLKENNEILNNVTISTDTKIYSTSRIIYSIQAIKKFHVIGIWNDNFVNINENNKKLILERLVEEVDDD